MTDGGPVESVEVSRGLAHAARIHSDLAPFPLLWPRSSIQSCLTPSRRPHIFVQDMFLYLLRGGGWLSGWLAGWLACWTRETSQGRRRCIAFLLFLTFRLSLESRRLSVSLPFASESDFSYSGLAIVPLLYSVPLWISYRDQAKFPEASSESPDSFRALAAFSVTRKKTLSPNKPRSAFRNPDPQLRTYCAYIAYLMYSTLDTFRCSR